MAHLFPFVSIWFILCSTVAAQGGGWQIENEIVGQASDKIGQSVAVIGDVNGDGAPDWAVGAPNASVGGISLSGFVQVHSGIDAALIHRIDGTLPYQNMGRGIATAGDINGDGAMDFIIHQTDSGPGLITTYSGADAGMFWSVGSPSGGGEVLFGSQFGGGHDVNNDGVPDVITSDPYEDVGGYSENGRVFVLSGVDGSTLYNIAGPGWNDFEYFGADVHLISDANGDGHADFLIGKPDLYIMGFGGEVQLRSGADGTILYSIWGSQFFGSLITPLADLNQDGITDFLVKDDHAALLYSGADGSEIWRHSDFSHAQDLDYSVYTDFDLDGYPDVLIATLGVHGLNLHSGQTGELLETIPSATGTAPFYFAAGDLNGDDLGDILFTDPLFDDGGPDNGKVYDQRRNPFLYPSTFTLSAAAGGTVDYQLDFPLDAAFENYQTLVSGSGLGPVVLPNGVIVDLTLDNWLASTFLGDYFGVFTTPTGTLAADATGLVQLNLPAGMLPGSMIGTTFHVAVVTSSGGMNFHYASESMPLTFEP